MTTHQTARRIPAHIRKNRSGAFRAALFEPLESRELFSVDLTGAFTPVDATVSNGTKEKITLSLTNDGTSAAKSGIQVAIYAALAGQSFSPSADIFLGQFVRKANLAAGASAPLSITVPLSAAIPGGAYQFFAVIDPHHHFAGTSTPNNTVSSGTFLLTQPNDDLAAGFPSAEIAPVRVAAGTSIHDSINVTITNPGTSTASIPAGISVKIQIFAHLAGSSPSTPEIFLNRSAFSANVGNLAPGASRTFSVPIQFPASLSAGIYQIIADVNSSGVLAEANLTDNLATLPGFLTVLPAPKSGSGGSGSATTVTGNVGNLNPPTLGNPPAGTGSAPTNTGKNTGAGTGTPPTGGTNPISGTGSTPVNSTGTTPTNPGGTTPTGSIGTTPTGGIGDTPTNFASLTTTTTFTTQEDIGGLVM